MASTTYELMSLGDVARELKISRQRARRLFDDAGGTLPKLAGFGRHVKTSRDHFDAWIGRRATSSAPVPTVAATSEPTLIDSGVFS